MKIMKPQFFGALAFVLWTPISWLYLNPPNFLAGQPLAIYVVSLFFGGLAAAATALLLSLRMRVSERAARVYVFLFVLAFVGAYQFSGLAPSWQCFGKKLEAAVGRAAGQNCRTTCTNNDKKPCSGWSSCWDKFVSCSSAGIDQGGRNCQGCCFSCDVVCEDDDPPPPSYQPPTVSGSIACSQAGSNGWCVGTSTLEVSASDPQGFALTISGTINEFPFTCTEGNTCSLALPEGSGFITYIVTAATSSLSSSAGAATWQRDGTAPVVNATYPSPNGLNGWHVTSPVAVSAGGFDTLSGLASALVSVNGGVWQSNASLMDGTYVVNFRTVDNAGNSSTLLRTIRVDTTPPTVSPVIPSPDGLNNWFITAPLNVSVNGADSGSGLASALASVDGSVWQPSLFLSDGVYTASFRSTDNAGNTATATRIVKVDASLPSIVTSISGTAGNSGWYTSQTTTSISADELSGVDHIEYNQNGAGWRDGSSVVSSEGINQIDIKIHDVAGNVASGSLEIKVDTTPPVISTSIAGTVGLADWYVSQATTSISASDENSGMDRVEYNQNSDGWQRGSSVVSDDGVNTIGVRAYDVAGNMSTNALQIKVDTIAPIVTPALPSPDGLNNWFITAPIAVSANGSDSGSGLASAEVSVNSGLWRSSAALPDGEHAVDFKVIDNAGNTSTVSRTVKVDTVAPSLSTSTAGTLGLAGWYISQVTTTISANDENSGVDHIEYDQNRAGWLSGSSAVSDDGVNTMDIRAYDLAGNMASDSLQIKVDTIAPVVLPAMPSPDGLNNWFVTAPVDVSAKGSDSGSGLMSADVSVKDGKWQSDASLSDGIYEVAFQAIDHAGNSTTTSRTVKVDTVAPSLSTAISGVAGRMSWYVSQITTSISARDETSGVDRIEYNENSSEWQDGTSVVSKDGVNDIHMRAYDLAGNMSSDSLQVKIDTVKPTSKFTAPVNDSTNTLVRGTYNLSGSSADTTSGVASSEISLDGKIWLPLAISSGDKWTYDWDTLSWGDGVYPIVVRTTDVAGNTELIESGAHVSLLVNNAPPHIKLTPGWFIWQSGSLVIKTEYFPVRDGMIIIADTQGRWPSVKIPFGEKYPAKIKWDRRFANGVLAPSGDYRVTVSACTIYDLCSEKKATIKIPWIAVVLPTEPVPTKMVEVKQEPSPQKEQPAATTVPPAVDVSVTDSEIQAESNEEYEAPRSLLSFVVFVALMWAISSAALSDKRPLAIRAIAKTIILQKHKGE